MTTAMNKNVKMLCASYLIMGLAESIWSSTLFSVWIFTIARGSNAKVGVVEAMLGLSTLFTAVPIGYAADKFGRDVVVSLGGFMLIFGILVTLVLVINPFSYSSDVQLNWFMVTQVIFGVSNAVIMGPAQALLADSVPMRERSSWYSKMQLFWIAPTIVGPLLTIGMFYFQGDSWDLSLMRPIFIMGLVLEIPAAVLLFFMNDKHSLKEDQEDDADTVSDDISDSNSAHCSSSDDYVKMEEGSDDADSDLDRRCSGSFDEETAQSPADVIRAPLLKKDTAYSMRVPLTLIIGDLFVAVGSGMTVKFVPLFFKTDIQLSPVAVQIEAIFSVLAVLTFTVFADKLKDRVGRIWTVFGCRLTGIVLLSLASLCVYQGYTSWYMIVPLFVLHDGLMYSVYPLNESLLMDNVPKDRRATWKSIECVGAFGWSGSAVLGGILSDQFHYSTAFMITVGLQLIGIFIQLSLVNTLKSERRNSIISASDSFAQSNTDNSSQSSLMDDDDLTKPLKEEVVLVEVMLT